MAKYLSYSPWAKTNIINDQYLDVLRIRAVPAEADDVKYTIQEQYTHRPDLLAHDFYGNHKLWWVFAQRNLNVLNDPIFDFEAGVEIYLPKVDTLKKFLGL